MEHLHDRSVFFPLLDRKDVPVDVPAASGSPLYSTLHRVFKAAFRSDGDTSVRSCDYAESGRLHLHAVPTVAERRLCGNERCSNAFGTQQ